MTSEEFPYLSRRKSQHILQQTSNTNMTPKLAREETRMYKIANKGKERLEKNLEVKTKIEMEESTSEPK